LPSSTWTTEPASRPTRSPDEPGSGDINVNGAAARLAHRDDTIIVISYAYDPDELATYTPRVVHVDTHNEIQTVDREVATLFGAPTAA
jgi:aspartate 1-decarboxylase